MKRGLKNNTFENYKYMYNTFVRPVIGSKRISTLKKSDIKKYYKMCIRDSFRDDENKKIILHPENKKMKDIIVDECCIQGVACHIIKEL